VAVQVAFGYGAPMTSIGSLFVGADALPAAHRVDPADNPPVYLVDGEVVHHTGEVREVRSPNALRRGGALEDPVIGHEAQLGSAEASRAVDAAARAYAHGAGAWPMAPAAERIAAVERLAAAIERATDRVATLVMHEIGKPWRAARKEVTRSVEYIRETIACYRRMSDGERALQSAPQGKNVHHARELRLPLGTVLCVAPFNYPVNEFLTTLVPALLVGNVVIGKLPRFGMLANLALAPAFAECFPPGVVSLLPGDGRALIPELMKSVVRHPDGRPHRGAIDMLAFIGSEAAAHAIIGYHPSPITLHKVLGLGAKNLAVVLTGADLAAAAKQLTGGALGFNGQRCTAEKLVFAPRADAERLAELIAAAVSDLRVGMPWDEGVAITPLAEGAAKLEWMKRYVDDATGHGARVMNGGGGEAEHTLMRPAVLYPVTAAMRIYHEEQFGPIVPVAPYDDIDEVLAWQRTEPFGQQVGIWGPEGDCRAVARAFAAEVSRVNLNDVCQRGPDVFGFTATDKSGFGILSLDEALVTFSRPVLLQSQSPEAIRP
jgi:glyceraldehyde-3-phosphate dehydrogenase (NADP+)